MTPEEFVCWLDGFRQSLIGTPNELGWQRINDALDSACRQLHASRKKPITQSDIGSVNQSDQKDGAE